MNSAPKTFDFNTIFASHFQHNLTDEQADLLKKLEQFTFSRASFPVFILSGYAGTGKTSVMGAYVKTLSNFSTKTILLAPTGRAAKVFSAKSGRPAYTIHKQIYRRSNKADDSSPVSLTPNLHPNTIFLVDEASMIGDASTVSEGAFGQKNILEDLLEYVFSGKNCKIIFLGDVGQLPPVGSQVSPALNKHCLQEAFGQLEIDSFNLKFVLRQTEISGILYNATQIRTQEDPNKLLLNDTNFHDVIRLSGQDFQVEFESELSKKGIEDTIVITRSNKRANLYNNQIRSRILWYEEQLCAGDCLMVVKNNYFWTAELSNVAFIANGESLKVIRVKKIEERYGFEFARLIVRFTAYDSIPEMEVIVLTESLQTESPSLPRERMKELFFAVEQDYVHERNKRKRYDLILKNPYFNALQVKYAYAVTCHKAQGGQWASVFVDQGYLEAENINEDYRKWLYTAITRATDKLFLVNFLPQFFGN